MASKGSTETTSKATASKAKRSKASQSTESSTEVMSTPLTFDISKMSKDELKLQEEMLCREMARRSYAEYLPYVHGKTWKRTRFSQFIAENVQRFIETDTGHAYDILLVESPPQHGKSMTISETLPSWYLGKHPKARVIEVSYNDDTAERFCRTNKNKIKDKGKTLFNIKIGKIDRSDHFELESGGSMMSRGIKAGITGNPADLMIVDDPIKNREEADSETTRSRVWAEWLNSMKSRLSAGAKVIFIMTPWHEDDIAARILKAEAGYVTLLRLPVEAQEDDLLGREPGEPLCPEIGKGAEWLAQFKQSYLSDPEGGPRAWSALYMCNPTIEGGNMVPRSWWQYYDKRDVREFGSECISVDAAFKDGESNDYVSIQVWGKINNDYFLRYCINEHLDFPSTMNRIIQVRHLFPNATRVYIEDKANGSAVIQSLQKQMVGVIGVNPLGGKVARVNAVSSAIETGHVFLPEGETWLEDYLRQWSEFPAGKHDDMVDASTQALSQMLHAWGGVDFNPKTEDEEYMEAAENEFLSSVAWDPYNVGEGWGDNPLNLGTYGGFF